MMDPYGLKNVRNSQSPEQPSSLGKAKELTGSCGVFSDGNSGLEKLRHGSISDNEANSCESTKLLEIERKCSNHDCISSIECAKEDTDDSRLLCSIVSTSKGSELMKEKCTEGASSEVPHCSGSLMDGNVSVHSTRGIDSSQYISLKSDVSSEDRQAHSKESNEFKCGRMNEYWVDAGEDALKSVMQETYHKRQPKSESCSSNTTRVIDPASSNDSVQETSADGKSSGRSKCSGIDVNTYINFKGKMEESAVKSSVMGMIAGDSTVIAGMSHILKSNLSKNENVELSNVKPSCEVNDALDVARRVARHMEREVVMYKEASGSCSSVQERSSETIHLGSIDSAVSNKDFLTETGSKIFGNEQDKCDSISSTKAEVDPEMSRRSKDLHLEVKEPSQEKGPIKKHEADDDLCRQGSSPIFRKLEDITANDQPTSFPRIDLNENILVNEVECPKQSISETVSSHAEIVSKPRPVVAKPGISVCLPKVHVQLDGEGSGWKGSAATSAFRRIALPNSFSMIKASSVIDGNSSSKFSQVNGIDLNIAAEGGDDMELLLQKCAQATQSFPSRVFPAGISSTLTEKFNIDLNCVGENDDNCHHPSPSTSLSRLCARNFDLNDNPVSADAFTDGQQPCQGTMALRDGAINDSVVTCSGNGRQPKLNSVGFSYWPDLSLVQSISHDQVKPILVAAPNMHPSFEQTQSAASLQQGSSYTAVPPAQMPQPPHAIPYNNAFYIDPNNHLSSTVYPLGVIPCVADPRSATVFPHILGGSSAVPAFSGAPFMMQVPGGSGPSNIAFIRPSFNLNGGVASPDSGTRIENGRQWFIPVNNATTEDQMRPFQQLALSSTPLKRKEPEGGLDSHKLGLRQMTPRH